LTSITSCTMTNKRNNVYLRFTSVGIQMGAIIGGMVWLGMFLQHRYAPKGVWFTVGFSLFGVMAAIYLVIKEVISLSKEEENEK
jgi:F0F1-type ATP synthase assembly protein I